MNMKSVYLKNQIYNGFFLILIVHLYTLSKVIYIYQKHRFLMLPCQQTTDTDKYYNCLPFVILLLPNYMVMLNKFNIFLILPIPFHEMGMGLPLMTSL